MNRNRMWLSMGIVGLALVTACGRSPASSPAPAEPAAAPVVAGVERAIQADIVRAFASSEKEGNMAVNAMDGDKATRWESEWLIDPSWIAFELKDKRIIEAIRILWEFAGASQYKIEISDDGQTWREVASITDGKENELRTIRLSQPAEAKFIRVLGVQRIKPEYGYSLFEIELNPLTVSPADKVMAVAAEASSVQSKDVPNGAIVTAAMAIDGNGTTRWSSDSVDPQWLTVELGAPTRIQSVKLSWEDAAARVYAIQVSTDKTNWQEVARVSNGASKEERIISFAPVDARYVRVSIESRLNLDWGSSIFEFEVYK